LDIFNSPAFFSLSGDAIKKFLSLMGEGVQSQQLINLLKHLNNNVDILNSTQFLSLSVEQVKQLLSLMDEGVQSQQLINVLKHEDKTKILKEIYDFLQNNKHRSINFDILNFPDFLSLSGDAIKKFLSLMGEGVQSQQLINLLKNNVAILNSKQFLSLSVEQVKKLLSLMDEGLISEQLIDVLNKQNPGRLISSIFNWLQKALEQDKNILNNSLNIKDIFNDKNFFSLDFSDIRNVLKIIKSDVFKDKKLTSEQLINVFKHEDKKNILFNIFMLVDDEDSLKLTSKNVIDLLNNSK